MTTPLIRTGTKLDYASRLVLGGGLALCLAGLALVFDLAGGTAAVLSSRSYAVYAVLGLAGAAFFVLALTRSAETRVGLSVTFLLCLAGIGLAELYLGRPEVVNPSVALARQHGVSFDVRRVSEVVAERRRVRSSASLAVYPEEFIDRPLKLKDEPAVPLGSVAAASIALCNESGDFVFIETDELGFNNPKGLWPGPVDILIVGDSYAEGWCHPREVSFAGLLRERFPKLVNLGRGGLGSLAELAALREYLPVLRPRLVLWFYYDNDQRGLEREIESPILKRYLDDPAFTQHLFERQDAIAPAVARHAEEQLSGQLRKRELPLRGLRSLFNEILPRFVGIQREAATDVGESLSPHFSAVMTKAKAAATEQGAELRFVYLGSLKTVLKPTLWERTLRQRDLVMAEVERQGIPALDLLAEMTRRDPEHPNRFHIFGESGHYTKEGHALVAELVGAWLDGSERPKSKLAPAHP